MAPPAAVAWAAGPMNCEMDSAARNSPASKKPQTQALAFRNSLVIPLELFVG
jgi:hypothetical protein